MSVHSRSTKERKLMHNEPTDILINYCAQKLKEREDGDLDVDDHCIDELVTPAQLSDALSATTTI